MIVLDRRNSPIESNCANRIFARLVHANEFVSEKSDTICRNDAPVYNVYANGEHGILHEMRIIKKGKLAPFSR